MATSEIYMHCFYIHVTLQFTKHIATRTQSRSNSRPSKYYGKF